LRGEDKMAKVKAKSKKPVVTKEVAMAIKAFKNSDEVNDFYQFIHDNGLRNEAHQLMSSVLKAITPAKKRGRKKVLH
jgi:hypothetical protein